MDLQRVVVTGLGALTPIGNTVDAFWANLQAGVSGAGPITYFDASAHKTQFACEVKDFDVEAFMDRRSARRIDRFTQYALAAVAEAVADAGLDFDQLDRDRVGVIWGSALGGVDTFEEQVTAFATGEGGPRFSPFFIPRILADSSSGMIALEYGVHGVNFNAVSACASANSALISAFDSIRLGKADVIISGGSDAGITPAMVGGFNALKALSTRNDDPAHASRPFDTDRDGFVMGEGAGALILEELGHAQRRGAPVYAEFVGGAMSADAYHATSTHPEGVGALLSMRNALADAGLAVDAVDYVNAHATSTPAGDISELLALRDLLGDYLPRVNISATKSMTGHLLGAAGAVESIACILAVRDGVAPPTINVTTPDAEIPPGAQLTLGTAMARPVTVALNNSFGFGGHNATTVFRRYVGA